MYSRDAQITARGLDSALKRLYLALRAGYKI